MTHKSIPELISGLLGDAKEIAGGHATKMRGEIKDEFRGLKVFLAKVAIAVGAGILGSILLAHAAALGLDALGVPQWLAYLIAAVIGIVAAVLLLKRLPADKTDFDLVPESTIADFKRDMKSLKNDVKDEVKTEMNNDGHRPIHAH